ncbi:cuticle protein AMP4-like [Macrobrachium rosenbergii]|uniref:cuticle protein AMP4-like n=1 Tax=Macrobrachium rosenbergii TaxID=79674 RepID=UPI0034D7B790
MKIIIFIATLALASGRPQDLEDPEPVEVIEILRDERVQPEEGAYSFQVETENGIVQKEEGVAGTQGQTNVEGSFSYPLEDGTVVEVSYIADENGFQVQSPLLPVAPEFPHPIPQFVLDQIAFAEEQRRLEQLKSFEDPSSVEEQLVEVQE